jgi:hypothetical protein
LDAASSGSFGCHLVKVASPRVRSDPEDARDTLTWADHGAFELTVLPDAAADGNGVLTILH